jgi:hypothetical protein
MDLRILRSPASVLAVLMSLASTVCACGPSRFQGASTCAPPRLTVRVGSSAHEAGSCAGMYRYLGLVKLEVGDAITAEIPQPRPPGALPESSAPGVVAVVSRASNGRKETLKAVGKGTAVLIVRTPVCQPRYFVTTPSPQVVGSKAASGPCRIMQVEVTDS